MALDIKKILKGLRILNDSDSTKALELSVSGSTNTKTTVTTSQTANRTITLPDATDTLVGKATTDVLTNKSIDADTNTITNIENADIKSGAAIDATKIHDGTVDNTEFGYLNGVTSAIQTQLNNKENSSNKGIANGYASLDSNGLVPTTQMPPAALERLVVVADQAARFALTTATVQNGDTVYQNDTTTMYFVKDDTNLGNSSGYTIYSAGTSVNFSGSLAGDIAGTQGATTYNNVVPVAKGGTNSSSALTNNKVIVSTAGAIVESAVTSTTLGYLDATSSVQTQLDAKIAKSLVTTTGDMIYASGASTPARLPVGGSGQVLKSVGGLPTWATFSGGINYLSSNPDAEADTAGWATYADAAASSPVDGTGGSPSSTYTRSTSSPLRGTASFLWTKSAANRQGEGFSYDFTIDASDKAKVLQISFDYLVSSGTYADSDMTIWIYDVTNAALIQPAGYTIQNVVGSMNQKATFQAASNSTSYRLIVHTASTSASAYTLQFDNFAVGPQIVTNGAAITDAVAYTPTTQGLGTISGSAFYYSREGDSIYIRGNFTAGTTTASEARVNLPTGLTVDSSKVGTNAICGYGNPGNSGSIFAFPVIATGGNAYVNFGKLSASTTSQLVPQNGSDIIANSVSVAFTARIPVTGWSSNVQLSSDTDTRVVAMYADASATSLSAGTTTTIVFTTVTKDTHGAFNGTTFTAPVSGFYSFNINYLTSSVAWTASDQLIQYYSYNGGSNVELSRFVIAASLTQQQGSNAAKTLQLNAGDTLVFKLYSTRAVTLTEAHVNMFRLSGPAVVAASESVAALYTGAPPTGTLTSAYNTTTFGTKVKDSHNAYSSGTYTVPVSGTYSIAAATRQAATYSVGQVAAVAIYIDGTRSYTSVINAGGAQTNSQPIVTAFSIPLLAGQLITIRSFNNATTPTFTSAADENYFSITKTGNY